MGDSGLLVGKLHFLLGDSGFFLLQQELLNELLLLLLLLLFGEIPQTSRFAEQGHPVDGFAIDGVPLGKHMDDLCLAPIYLVVGALKRINDVTGSQGCNIMIVLHNCRVSFTVYTRSITGLGVIPLHLS